MTDLESFEILKVLFSDDSTTELMWNGYHHLFIEQGGKLTQIDSPFESQEAFELLILKLQESESSTKTSDLTFDGILPDGSRFHITLPPLSPFGPTLTIRRFSKANRGIRALVNSGFLTEKASVFLAACVKARMNLIISGAAGSGKTTLLNALASQIGRDERIITVEDIPEISLDHSNWVRLIAQPHMGQSVRRCLTGTLRMRPDRIIVGECRSSEALEMLQVMNTGHDGCISTIHSNSASDTLTRLESLVLFHAGVDIPIKALRKQIADTIDLIVHVTKSSTGQRQVDEILQIVGMEGDVITRLPIFHRLGRRKEARLVSAGHVPTFISRVERYGTLLPKNFFDPSAFELIAPEAA